VVAQAQDVLVSRSLMTRDTRSELSSAISEVPVGLKVLLVDDDEAIRHGLSMVFDVSGFEIASASNVNDAHKFMTAQTFDVLVSGLEMPSPGDGLTVVSAMRHSNPKATTFIFSQFHEMNEAARATLLQADQFLSKPMTAAILVETVMDRLRIGAPALQHKDNVANILEYETPFTIAKWLKRVEAEPDIITVSLPAKERSAHLPALFHDLVTRLRNPLPLGTRALLSDSAFDHGLLRREQGYTAAMMVEESRMLQVSIFETLQENLQKVDFKILLADVMTIADEVDAQLAQAMASYISEAKSDGEPVDA
jgi:YesN/AraC family two-component response regulator